MAEFNLGKQIGPLPLGMWVVVVAAGLGVGYLINRNANKPAADEQVPVQLTPRGTGVGAGEFEPVPPPPPATVPTPDSLRPPPPTNLRVIDTSFNHVRIVWDPSPGAAFYKLTASSALGLSARTPIISETEYTWTPLAANRVVTLSVSAGNANGFSAPVTITATTDQRP